MAESISAHVPTNMLTQPVTHRHLPHLPAAALCWNPAHGTKCESVCIGANTRVCYLRHAGPADLLRAKPQGQPHEWLRRTATWCKHTRLCTHLRSSSSTRLPACLRACAPMLVRVVGLYASGRILSRRIASCRVVRCRRITCRHMLWCGAACDCKSAHSEPVGPRARVPEGTDVGELASATLPTFLGAVRSCSSHDASMMLPVTSGKGGMLHAGLTSPLSRLCFTDATSYLLNVT